MRQFARFSGVFAAVSVGSCGVPASAALVAVESVPSVTLIDGHAHFTFTVVAEFSSSIDTVLNVYGMQARPAGLQWHHDFLAAAGSAGVGTWSPSLVSAGDAAVDSWCTIGGAPGSFANTSTAEPGWGPPGWNQPGIPALAGWFNPNPPNLQGRVDSLTRRVTLARFAFRDAVTPFTTPITIGFNQGLGTPAQSATGWLAIAADAEGDGIPDAFDNCPSAANPGQEDADGDAVGNACDNCPAVMNAMQADGDGDAFGDACDGCPSDAAKIAPGQCGCGAADTDSDADGTADCNDGCPSDPAKVSPGQCGCGVADTDTDADGIADCNDGCPSDPAKVSPGQCGCGVADVDSDGDAAADCIDGCMSDAGKTEPGDCGCGQPDRDANSNGISDCLEVPDADGDGVPDAEDRCPLDPGKSLPGTCGCGTADVDGDADGLVDCLVVANIPQVGLMPASGLLPGDDFGAAVAMDGGIAVVGLPLDDLVGKVNAGTARVFQWSGTGWSPVAELAAPSADAKANDGFGASVAIHGEVIVIGAPNADLGTIADAGAAFVYRRSGNAWPFEAKLTRATPAATDLFGSAVAVRGDLIAVGAPQANAGSLNDAGEVRIFNRGPTAWTGTAAVTGVPATAGDRFGQAVALGGIASSPLLVAGCPGDDQPAPASNCGAAYAVALTAAGTASSSTRLVGNPAMASAALGSSVAVDGEGLRVAAGAPTAAPPGIGTNGGSVTAWTRSGAAWIGVNLSPMGHASNDRLGRSVAFDPTGATLVIGNPTRTEHGVPGRGGAVVYSRLASGAWVLHDRLLVDAPGASASQFGAATAAGVHGLLVGGPKNAPGGAVAAFAAPGSCATGDSDGDGTGDACDDCPLDAGKLAPGTCGCGTTDADSDADGMADCYDACPSDPAKTAPGTCGCGVPETDTDADGTRDCLDADDDNDGTGDGSDGCPLHAIKTAPGQCGCAVVDTDSDADGTADCLDLCPSDPAKVAPGTCGCGVSDHDADGDGLVDCLGDGILAETGPVPMVGVLAGDDLGAAVSGDASLALVGLPLDDLAGKANAGTARIAEWTGTSWSERAQLLAPSPDAKANDNFGASVSIHGDVAVVGAPNADVGSLGDAGAAYVYRNVAGAWILEAKLTRTGAAATDRFGTSVAVLGDFLAVGVPLANLGSIADAGEVRLFRRMAGAWTHTATLTAGIATATDRFGHAVALGGSVSAPSLVVGCPGDDETGKANCGAAYIHAISSVGTVLTVTRVISPAPLANAALGTCVTVDATGTRVAAGAPLADVPGGGTDCGSVTVWSLAGPLWSGVEVCPADRMAGENLGASVSLRADGLALVVGAPLDTVGGIAARGSAAVMTFDGMSWTTHDRLTLPPSGASGSNFGRSVSFRGSSILVGGPKHSPPAGGTVRGFEGP